MEKENKNLKIIIVSLTLLIVILLALGVYFIFIKKDTGNDQPQNIEEKGNYNTKEDNDDKENSNQINVDSNNENNIENKNKNEVNNNSGKAILGLSGTYKNRKTGKSIKIEETEDKVILYENNKILFEQEKYNEEREIEVQPETLDNLVIIGFGSGQTYEYAIIVNKLTKEIVHDLIKVDSRGAYSIYKVKDGYFFVLEGNMNNEAPYFYEAFSDKTDIINLKWNCKSEYGDDDNFCYNTFVYDVSKNNLYFAKEKDKRDNNLDVRISKVDVNGKYNYSSYYEAVLCIENEYALVIKKNTMYLVDLNNNYKEYKIANYSNDELSSWHIKKEKNMLYVNNWSEDITEYIFNIDTKKVSIFNEE